MAAAASKFNFAQLPVFAAKDQEFISNHLNAKVVDTRFELKTLLETNWWGVSACATNALSEASKGHSDKGAFEYLTRKISGFTKNSQEDGDDSAADVVKNATKAAYTAYYEVTQSPEAMKLFNDQAVERKKYKTELENLLKDFKKNNPGQDLTTLSKAEVAKACDSLGITGKTKDYCVYKVGYMFDVMTKLKQL